MLNSLNAFLENLAIPMPLAIAIVVVLNLFLIVFFSRLHFRNKKRREKILKEKGLMKWKDYLDEKRN
jgi:hypothetical protein